MWSDTQIMWRSRIRFAIANISISLASTYSADTICTVRREGSNFVKWAIEQDGEIKKSVKIQRRHFEHV